VIRPNESVWLNLAFCTAGRMCGGDCARKAIGAAGACEIAIGTSLNVAAALALPGRRSRRPLRQLVLRGHELAKRLFAAACIRMHDFGGATEGAADLGRR
jgi:hypothetical protein